MIKFNKLSCFILINILIFNLTACKTLNIINKYEFIIFKDKITGERRYITKKERNRMLVEDLDYFKKSFLEYPSNFNKCSIEDFEEKIEELKNSIDKLSDLDFFIELEKINSMLRESHLFISKNRKRAYLQMEKILIGNDIHINSFYVDDEFKYGKLIKINEIDVETLKKKFRKITPADNYSTFLYNMDIEDIDLLYGLKIIDNVEDVTVTLEKNGKIKSFLIKPIISEKYVPISVPNINSNVLTKKKYIETIERVKKGEVVKPNPRIDGKNYEYVNREDKQSIILNYDGGFEDVGRDRLKFFKNLSETIENQRKKNKLNRIIVDVRRNTGGFRWIIKPFYEFLSEFLTKNKDVNLIILCDRATISGGMLAVLDLRKTTDNCNVVGMPPGGGINFAGGSVEDQMPNSGIYFNISPLYYAQPRYDTYETIDIIPNTSEEEYAKNMLIPDIEAYKTVEDYEKNTDSVLERALNGEFDRNNKE